MRRLLVLVITLSVLLAGCASAVKPLPTPVVTQPTAVAQPTTAPIRSTVTPKPVPTITTATGFPITVTDDAGRKVTFSHLPRRIVSLAPGHTETLYALGDGDRMVKARPGWAQIAAVRNDRIVPINAGYLSRPSPRLVDGLEQLARIIHPELFK